MRFTIRNLDEYKTNNEMTKEKWFDAVDDNNINLIKEYLENGFDINCKDWDNETVLIISVRLNKFEIVMELLKHLDLHINTRDSFNKETALIKSCKFSDLRLVQNLLKFPNIDINCQDIDNNTALIWACFGDKIEIAKELLKQPNIKINLKDKCNKTALDYAIENGNQEMIKLLKEAGAKD